MTKYEAEVPENDTKFKLSAKIMSEFYTLELSAELFESSEGSICVEFTKLDGPTYELMKVFEKFKQELEEVAE